MYVVPFISHIFPLIDAMPYGKRYQKGSPRVQDECGVFYVPQVQHCFRDDTHQTCCLLGAESRKYADSTANPIGKASEDAFYKNYGFFPDSHTLTPWCTCIGSQVCSFYQKKFGSLDGTHIKFIHNQNQQIVHSPHEYQFIRRRHKTPGVYG